MFKVNKRLILSGFKMWGEKSLEYFYFGSDATEEVESVNPEINSKAGCAVCKERNKQSNKIKCNYEEASFSPEKIEDKFLYKMNLFI